MAWEQDIRKAFESKITPEPNTGCWLWTGRTFEKRGGYGCFTHRPSGTIMERAHRISWVLHNGSLTRDNHVLHKCDVRACVNPDHLFLGDQKDNMEDMAYKKRQAIGKKHGHYKHGRYIS